MFSWFCFRLLNDWLSGLFFLRIDRRHNEVDWLGSVNYNVISIRDVVNALVLFYAFQTTGERVASLFIHGIHLPDSREVVGGKFKFFAVLEGKTSSQVCFSKHANIVQVKRPVNDLGAELNLLFVLLVFAEAKRNVTVNCSLALRNFLFKDAKILTGIIQQRCSRLIERNGFCIRTLLELRCRLLLLCLHLFLYFVKLGFQFSLKIFVGGFLLFLFVFKVGNYLLFLGVVLGLNCFYWLGFELFLNFRPLLAALFEFICDGVVLLAHVLFMSLGFLKFVLGLLLFRTRLFDGGLLRLCFLFKTLLLRHKLLHLQLNVFN